jgi:2-keto-4-pentenoate hydratase
MRRSRFARSSRLPRLDLGALEVVTSVNGRGSRERPNVGSPLEALGWLANALARMGRGLEPGELVTTGCCMDVLELGAGDTAVADFGPLGRVRVEFTD